MRMSRYARRGRARQNGEKNSFWLSFSDLMSALVLVIILVLFYILYQYFLMYDDYEERRDQMVVLQASLEQSEADIAAQQAALTAAQDDLTAAQSELDEKTAALNTAQDELTTAQNDLTAAQDELTAAQEDLAVQQMLLEAAQEAAAKTQEELDAQEAQLQQTLTQLDEQQAQLETQQSQLEAQQDQMSAQQSQIAAQQSQLEQQQKQIEDLVGVRTQIIADLSSALREANISATVDPTSGAIALASDVLFATGESELTEAGRGRIDAFLPVYLDVLFSEEYRRLCQRDHHRGPHRLRGQLYQQPAPLPAARVQRGQLRACRRLPLHLRGNARAPSSGDHGQRPLGERPHLRRRRHRGPVRLAPRGVQVPPDRRADGGAAAIILEGDDAQAAQPTAAPQSSPAPYSRALRRAGRSGRVGDCGRGSCVPVSGVQVPPDRRADGGAAAVHPRRQRSAGHRRAAWCSSSA